MTADEMSARVLSRTDDPTGVTATPDEVMAALNEGQELAAWLTLSLETTATLTLAPSTTFGQIRQTYPDFLAPLRLAIGNQRLRPSTLAELDSLNEQWQSTLGTPQRYVTLGWNLYAVTPQPVIATAATLIYARSPVQLVGDDFPEIEPAFHLSLVKYAKYRLRLKEGAQGLARGMGFFNAFLDDMTRYGDFVRARSRAARYDTLPLELQLFDRSRLVMAAQKAAAKKS